jgi:hypothetical protein
MRRIRGDMLGPAVRPQEGEDGWLGSCSSSKRRTARLPNPSLSSAVPNWGAGDTIPLGRRTLRVVGMRDDEADEVAVLVVEDVAG